MTEVTEGTAVAMPNICFNLLDRKAARELIEAAGVLLEKAEKFAVIPSDADAELASEFRARLNDTINKLDAERLAGTEEARSLVKRLNEQANEKIDPMREVLKRTDKVLQQFRADKEAKRLAAIEAQRQEEARLAKEKEEAEKRARAAQEDAQVAQQLIQESTAPEHKAQAQALLEQANAAIAQAAVTVQQVEQRAEVVSQAVVPSATPKGIRGTHGSMTSTRDNWTWRLIDTPEQPAAESVKLVPEAYLREPLERLNRGVLTAKARSIKQATTTAIPGIEIYNDPFNTSRVAS